MVGSPSHRLGIPQPHRICVGSHDVSSGGVWRVAALPASSLVVLCGIVPDRHPCHHRMVSLILAIESERNPVISGLLGVSCFAEPEETCNPLRRIDGASGSSYFAFSPI